MTCDGPLAAKVWPGKQPESKYAYGVDFEEACARQWSKWTDFEADDAIRIYLTDARGNASGFEFVAIVTGRSGGRMPAFPSSIDAEVRDGSLVWKCRALSNASLFATIVGTPTWTADPGVTIGSQSLNGMKAAAIVDGGSEGIDYAIRVQAELSDGTRANQVCILPVRKAVRVCEET